MLMKSWKIVPRRERSCVVLNRSMISAIDSGVTSLSAISEFSWLKAETTLGDWKMDLTSISGSNSMFSFSGEEGAHFSRVLSVGGDG